MVIWCTIGLLVCGTCILGFKHNTYKTLFRRNKLVYIILHISKSHIFQNRVISVDVSSNMHKQAKGKPKINNNNTSRMHYWSCICVSISLPLFVFETCLCDVSLNAIRCYCNQLL